MPHIKLLSSLIAAQLSFAGVLLSGSASAETTIRTGTPPQYGVEIEPHFNFQPFNDAASTIGFGGGVRFSIPVMSPGFIKTIDDSIAIGFGADFVHFGGGEYRCDRNICVNGPSYWAVYVPVVMQWNFFLNDKWSVFGEPGLAIRHGFSERCDIDGFGCNSVDTVRPAFFGGARFKFGEGTSLTMRIGYPVAASVGISFF